MRIVLTRLEGCLLDPQTNSYGAARQALAALERRSIPLLLISHWTRAQVDKIRQQLQLRDPFVVEAGTVIYIPEHYFPASILDEHWSLQADFFRRAAGLPYQDLRQSLGQVRSQLQVDLVGFGDWTAEELAMTYGFTVEDADLAKARETSEIFSYAGHAEQLYMLLNREMEAQGYHLHLSPLESLSLPHQWYLTTSPSACPDPVRQSTQILLDCYRSHLGVVSSLGISCVPADAGFLGLTGTRIVLPGPHREPRWAEITQDWHLAQLPGPEGWNEAVLMWLEETDHGDDE